MDAIWSWLPAVGIGYVVVGILCWGFMVFGKGLFTVFWHTCWTVRDYIVVNVVIFLMMLIAWPIVLYDEFKESPNSWRDGL